MKKNIFFVFILLFTTSLFSQTNLLHEIGFISGPVSMQTDFGERHHFPSTVLNIGYGVGLVYYVSVDPNKIRWNQRGYYLQNHLKVRFELSYMQDKLIQRGRYIENNSVQANLLKNIVANPKLFNAGAQIQFSIFSASDFRNLEPYFSLGGMYTSYKPQIESLLGDLQTDTSILPNAYIGGIHNDGDSTGSLVLGAGTTYNTNNNLKLIFDFRWQRFIKDDIDGLMPLISANKYNDWLFFLNIGVAFKLN